MAIIRQRNTIGTLKRTIRIPVNQMAEFEKTMKEKGWTVDNIARDIEVLKNLPKKQYTDSELEIINKEILDECKQYRRETFKF